MKKTCVVTSAAFALFALASVSALWSERIGESILGVSNPVWLFFVQAYGADTVDPQLDLAFNGTAILLLANAFWWFGYAWHFIDTPHPSWTWPKETYGVDHAYRMLDWAFPATSIVMLVAAASAARCAIARHRRSLA